MFPLLVLFAADTGDCFEAVRTLSAGAPIRAEDVMAVACDGKRDAVAVRYDRSARAALPVAAVPTGGYLGRISVLPSGAVVKGERLTLRSSAGPVVIEREVTALQSGRSGERIFVQDANGAVFAAALLLSPGAAQ
ncbi:MAG: flagella basal body P-ring formation protein FlgA [Sphingomonas sp.]|uniref:flagella basal body P-ring formation protein FlgA n=1 Tax=Sphingomonas sp. TaxID=28214 RepID=UPI00227285B7|nr:flagella basal body P-ring formation protein FlgA [Sphingomonas sp.]MCX8475453.1 flagella basal body P-ring formation protein FlgA [Sphingomonas sp.]